MRSFRFWVPIKHGGAFKMRPDAPCLTVIPSMTAHSSHKLLAGIGWNQ